MALSKLMGRGGRAEGQAPGVWAQIVSQTEGPCSPSPPDEAVLFGTHPQV